MAFPGIGSDGNILPVSFLDELDSAGAFVPVNYLQNPFMVSMAVQEEGVTMELKRNTKLTVELKLSTGPLKLNNTLWLISE